MPRSTALALHALLLAGGTFAAMTGHAATPAPIPVTVTNAEASQPFQTTVSINIADGANAGSANGILGGSQTFVIPAGKRLVIQSASMYRSGSASAGSQVQVFVDVTFNGVFSGFALPPAVKTGATFAGSTQPMTAYADGGASVLVNAFRDTSSGYDFVYVAVSGYLVNMP